MDITHGSEWVVSAWWVLALGRIAMDRSGSFLLASWSGFRRFSMMGFGIGSYQRWGVSAWIGVGFSFRLLDFRVAVVGFGVSVWWVSILGSGFSSCCGFVLWWLWVCIIYCSRYIILL